MVESIAKVKGLLHSIKLVALSLSRKLRLRESIELLAEMVVAPDTSGPTIHAHGFLIRRSQDLLFARLAIGILSGRMHLCWQALAGHRRQSFIGMQGRERYRYVHRTNIRTRSLNEGVSLREVGSQDRNAVFHAALCLD